MTRKGSTIATDLFNATRLTNSTNGNPRYELHTSDGNFRTQSDAACSYDVANILRTIPRGGTIPVTLHTTPAGRVWNIERIHDTADDPHPLAEDATGEHPGLCLTCGHPA